MKILPTEFEAYDGDTYIKERKNSTNARYAWVSILIIAMIFSICVDIINLGELLERYLDKQILGWIMAVGISAIYIIVGTISGNCLRLYKSSDRKIYLLFLLICIVGTLAFLIIIALFRNNMEIIISGLDPVDAIYLTSFYTGAMLLGALASFVFGYFRKNALSEQLAISAIEHIAEDRELYTITKSNYISKNFNEKEFENKLREYNDSIKNHLSKIDVAKIKLLMVKNDPAEAHDVIEIANKIKDTII